MRGGGGAQRLPAKNSIESTVPPTGALSSSAAAATTSLSYALLMAGPGIYFPFFPLWLQGRGFAAGEIGLLLAIPMVMRVLATAPLAGLGDGPLGARLIFALAVLGAAAGYVGLYFGWSFWTVAAVLALTAAFLAPTTPLLDAIAIDAAVAYRFDYGRVRQWGSIGYFVASLSTGAMLGYVSVENLPFVLAALLVLTACGGWLLPGVRSPEPGSTIGSTVSVGPSRTHALLIIVGVALIQGSHSFLQGFGTLMWQEVGYSATAIGAFWAIAVICETAFFRVAGKLVSRIEPMMLIMLGGGAGTLRWLLMGLEPENGVAIVLLQAMHCLTFAATHIGTMRWLGQFRTRRATRQGLVAAAIGGGLALGSGASGFLFEAFGPHGFFVMSTVAALGGILVSSVWLIRAR